LSTAVAKLRRLFNFHLLFYYDMADAPSSTFNSRARRLAPSTSILVANFIPLQLQSSLPTSSLVAIQIPNPVTVLFPPFSLMAAAMCLMLLLLDDLLTKIIIQSIKDLAVFHFLNLRNKICDTSGASATPMRYYCTCRCMIFVRRARIGTLGRALSGTSVRPIIWRHCASRGCRG
jgi:hypothetical protein